MLNSEILQSVACVLGDQVEEKTYAEFLNLADNFSQNWFNQVVTFNYDIKTRNKLFQYILEYLIQV